MGCWYEGPLAAFDTETTGVDTERDRIVAAALVVQAGAGQPPQIRRWLVDPGIPVPGPAARVHGLSAEHLRAHGRPPGPVVEELARALAGQAAAGVPLVVMNAPFDLTLLDRELKRHRAASLTGHLGRFSLCVLDPLVLDKQLDRHREGRRTLARLCAAYDVPLAAPHDAASDAAAALGVVRALGRRYAPRLSRLSPAQLHTLQAVWYAAAARGLTAWFAPAVPGHPVDPAWPLRPGLPAAA
ncbi:3'-5' exonuclease [Streptomyces armeniacus]|uniref:3'-5' exonuclease n=1 Tax=Streptomyces armeniacus TaxID=83291 RepID=A0A345XL42_9ACTN|nr:exonuclease domain-containing protein [Streptomyces armeniacus]AXK32358.1 3'-5' exonuclease [Streptomyces armeniacus]